MNAGFQVKIDNNAVRIRHSIDASGTVFSMKTDDSERVCRVFQVQDSPCKTKIPHFCLSRHHDGDFAPHTLDSALKCGWFISFTAWPAAMKEATNVRKQKTASHAPKEWFVGVTFDLDTYNKIEASARVADLSIGDILTPVS